MSRDHLILLAIVGVACLLFRSYLGWKRPKNVILIVTDTTRADHLSLYGYERKTSPNLDAFGKESIVFDYAIASAPWTPPSIASTMTGLYVSSHGLMPPKRRKLAAKVSARLDSRLTTLAETLHAAGFQTLGVTPNPWTSEAFGFDKGFDKYVVQLRAKAEEINKEAFRLLDEASSRQKPFFLFLHYLDPHDPYTPPKPYDTAFQDALKGRKYSARDLADVNRYDGEIQYLDHHLGQLFRSLKERNLYEDSLIVIVADHGEQFRERGQLRHGYQLFDEEVHIPLLVRDGIHRYRADYTVSNVDIFPTVLAALGIAPIKPLQGISLFDEARLLERTGVLTEIRRKFNQKAFVSLDRKKLLLKYANGPEPITVNSTPRVMELYDTKQDSLEKAPLADAALQGNLRKLFDHQLETVLENKIEAELIEFDNKTLKQLRSLGYLN